MRIATIALLISATICAADARAENLYGVFRLGMTEAEAVQSATAHGGEMFNPEEREGAAPQDFGNFRFLFGGIPMDEDQAGGMFIFEKDRLRQIRFDYYFMPHMAEAELSAVKCGEKFERIENDIQAVYGAPAEVRDKTSDPTNETHEKDIVWRHGAETVHAHMTTHDMSHLYETPRCGMIEVRLFAGTETEQMEFETQLSGFLRRSPR